MALLLAQALCKQYTVTMNRLPAEQRALMYQLLVEGNSMASTMRIVRCSKNTVVKFLANAGRICHQYQDEVLRNLPCKRLEVDEIWSFIYAKNKNVQYAKNPPRGAGDVWTWTALCADTKLLASWMVGDRTVNTALPFMTDLQSRLRKRQRVQLTTDGHRAYLEAVDRTFGADVDYAMLVKMYGNTDQNEVPAHRRYSPGQCNGVGRVIVTGSPDLDKISTSYAERGNLTMRMSMRRFTRLTNAFSKKLENHVASFAMWSLWYNFGRVHQTIKRTPAMAAGVARQRWTPRDVIDLIDSRTPKPGPRGPYKKRKAVN